MLEYLIRNSSIMTHKQILVGVFPRLCATRKFDSYLMRALSDNNNLSNCLFIQYVKSEREIYSHQRIATFKEKVTGLDFVDNIIINHVQTKLKEHEGS